MRRLNTRNERADAVGKALGAMRLCTVLALLSTQRFCGAPPWQRHVAAICLESEARRPAISLDIDLGPDGEPRGVSRINFNPLLPESEIFSLQLGLPLGMLIEVLEDGGGSVAGSWYQKTRVVVQDALPGYSAYRIVRKGADYACITYRADATFFSHAACMTSLYGCYHDCPRLFQGLHSHRPQQVLRF